MFERVQLIKIRAKAERLAGLKGTNPHWVRAYLRLADAADHLDAMIARSSETKETGTEQEE